MNTNPTKYRMYLNYDNDNKVYVVPVLPEKIKITSKGLTTSVEIDKFGEVLHKGKREAIVISFSSFFPAKYGASYCACMSKEFKEPKAWHKWMIALQNAAKPCHFVLEGSPFSINIYADITSYAATEEGGDVGTINYTVELKEHRTPEIKTYKKGSKKTRKTGSGKRTNNKAQKKTYTVKKGDKLWNIAKKFYGNGKKKTVIYKANKKVIEKAAKKHGRSSSNKGRWLYSGTKLTIP